jgi:hypothetical protein
MDIEYYEEDGSLHFKFSNFRRRRNNDVGLHQPNVIDGGWIIEGNYNVFDGKYHVGYYEDSFAYSEIQDEIAFEVEPKKEYIVYFDAKHRLRLKNGQFTRTYRKPTPEEIKARLEKEAEERKKRQEEYRKKYNIPPDVLLPDNFLPLIRLTNPQLIRNKIFTEFPKETSESDTLNIHYVTKSPESWQKVPSLDGSVEEDLARIISEANLVNAMTKEHSKDEILEGLEQLRKIISSEEAEDNRDE